MPTTRTVTVKASGGDYTSLRSAILNEAKDLIALDRALVIELYNDVSETTPISPTDFGTWNTDATHDLVIRTAAGNKHGGRWNDSAWNLSVTNNQGIQFGTITHLTLDGLQIKVTLSGSSTPWAAIHSGASVGAGNILVLNCILRGNVISGTGSIRGIYIVDSSPRYRFVNCIAYDLGTGYRFDVNPSNTSVVYNCLAQNCFDAGFRNVVSTSNVRYKNCGAVACGDGWQVSTIDAASTNNSSDIAGDAPGASPITGSPVFVDAANDDFHLDAADTAWRGAGVDLSADSVYAFSNDIDDDARSAPWDIGPDEFVAAGGGGGGSITVIRRRRDE